MMKSFKMSGSDSLNPEQCSDQIVSKYSCVQWIRQFYTTTLGSEILKSDEIKGFDHRG